MNTTDSTRTAENELDAAIVRSLEERPAAEVPAGFALKVIASLPSQPSRQRRQSTSRIIAMVAAVLLAASVLVLAPHTSPSFASLAFDVELILLLQFVAIAYFLTPSRKS